jgi:hypothetical protein
VDSRKGSRNGAGVTIKRWPEYFLCFSLFLNAVTTLVGSLSYRFLMHDQTSYSFNIIMSRHFTPNGEGMRYFHALVELLPFLLLLAVPSSISITTYLTASGLCHWFFYFVGVVWAIWLSRRVGARDLFVPILLSFSLASQSALANVGGLVPDNLVFFWPALVLGVFSNVITYRSLAVLFLIVLCWSFSHESSILCLGFIGVVTAPPLFSRHPHRDFWPRFTAVLLCGLGCLWIFYRVSRPDHVDSQYFRNDFLQPLGWFRLGTVVMLAAWIVFLPFSCHRAWAVKALAGISWLVVCFFSYKLLFTPGSDFYWEAVRARTTILIAGLAIGALAVGMKWRGYSWFGSANGMKAYVMSALAIALVFSAVNDGLFDLHWLTFKRKLFHTLERAPGCSEFAEENPSWLNLEMEGLNPTLIGPLSILLQQKTSVTRALLWKYPQNHRVHNFCCSLRRGYLPMYEDGEMLQSGTFDFSPLFLAIDKQQLQCPKEGT